jgi:hypothetical protein
MFGRIQAKRGKAANGGGLFAQPGSIFHDDLYTRVEEQIIEYIPDYNVAGAAAHDL